jgi:transposase
MPPNYFNVGDYSMLGCCKAYGVNFRDWMVYFLSNVHNYDQAYSKDLAELLLCNFSKITAQPFLGI